MTDELGTIGPIVGTTNAGKTSKATAKQTEGDNGFAMLCQLTQTVQQNVQQEIPQARTIDKKSSVTSTSAVQGQKKETVKTAGLQAGTKRTQTSMQQRDLMAYRQTNGGATITIPTATGAQDIPQEELEAGFERFGAQMKDVLQELLGVSAEELDQAMETLGITAVTLVNPNTFAQAMAALTGTEDVSGLLLNEQFRQGMEQCEVLTEELAQELGNSVEDVKQLVAQQEEQKMTPSIEADTTTDEPKGMDVKAEMSEKSSVTQQTESSVSELENVQTSAEETITVHSDETVAEKTAVQPKTEQPLQTEAVTANGAENNITVDENNAAAQPQKEIALQTEQNAGQDTEQNIGQDGEQQNMTIVTEEQAGSAETMEASNTQQEQETSKPQQNVQKTVESAVPEETQQTVEVQTEQMKQENGDATQYGTGGQEEQPLAQEDTKTDSMTAPSEPKQTTAPKHEAVKQPEPQHAAVNQASQQTMTHTTAVEGAFSNQNMPQLDAQQIIEQVSEFARTRVRADGTTVSMQLNPENLGKVYMQITYKGGALTAQLAAQNQEVKELLEHQIVQLQDKMTQQGLKVQAIEVTIASHEFEQNAPKQEMQSQMQMNQNDHHGAGQNQEQQARRNLNFNVSDEEIQALFADLSEEDNLKAKVMLDQGNRVDMMA